MSVPQGWQVGLTASATLLSAAGAAMSLLFATELVVRGVHWLPWALSVGLAAPLMFGALGALLRRRAGLAGRLVAVFAVLSAAACWAALAALVSWSAAFDAADDGRDASATSKIALVCVLVAWALGSAAITAVLAALVPVPVRFLRRALAVLIGAIASLVVGAGLVTPGPVLVSSAVLMVLAVGPGPAGERMPTTPAASSRRWTRIAALLAWTSAALGAAAATFALTGSLWPGIALDATQAMQVGIGVGDLVALPLVASVALLVGGRVRRPAVIVASAALLAAALLIASSASFAGIPGSSDGQWNLLLAAVAVAAVAVALAAYALVPGKREVRATIAGVCGIALPVTVGIPLLAAAAFVLPPAAIAWAVWGVRMAARPRRGPRPALTPQP